MSRELLLSLGLFVFGCNAYGADVVENFTAISDQGIALTGVLSFDSGAFTPAPVAPSGGVYLTSFAGGPGSVSLQLDEASSVSSFTATSADLIICSGCNLAWDLTADSGAGSFNLLLNSLTPITFAPGSSVLYPGDYLSSASSLSGVLSDASSTQGFTIEAISGSMNAPEPGSFWTAGVGLTLLLAAMVAIRKRQA